MERVDYNAVQYRDYARGRTLLAAQRARGVFEAAGWLVADFAAVDESSPGTRAAVLDRLRLRTLTTSEQFTEAELATGFERLEAAVATVSDKPVAPSPSTLLTLTMP